MGQAIGQVLSFGVGVALSPVPIIAVVLMLATPDGRVNGPALILGWILGLAAAGTIVLLAASGTEASSTSGPAEWVSIVMIVLGVVLMALATRQGQGPTRRCRGPASSLDEDDRHLHSAQGRGHGSRSLGAQPKEPHPRPGRRWPLRRQARAAVTKRSGSPCSCRWERSALAFQWRSTSLMRDRATEILESLRDWRARENGTIMAVLCLIIRAKLIGQAISALTT